MNRKGGQLAALFASLSTTNSVVVVERKVPLVVIFCLAPAFLGATIRQYGFMLRGLEEVEGGLEDRAIPFYLLQGNPGTEISRFIRHHAIGTR